MNYPAIYVEAAKRFDKDATQSTFEEHLAAVAFEHGTRAETPQSIPSREEIVAWIRREARQNTRLNAFEAAILRNSADFIAAGEHLSTRQALVEGENNV